MSLQEAQMEKYKRLCEKLKLNSSDRVLEIGSGWGGNAIFIAKNYGCSVTSVTISEEQLKFAREKVAQENLSEKIKIELLDYRKLEGQFDKIISIEMLEAVGDKFFEVYFKKCHELLKKNGILALQVITCPDSRYENLRNGVDWIQKHIFPGSLLPSVARINRAINSTGDLSLVDLKEFGLDYAKTLSIWKEQFNKNISTSPPSPLLKERGGFVDEKFIRKWNYYFSYCEAAFAMRNINVMQLVYSRPNNISR
jgi:cyclopropane-fatty-acyl-phospholipid synthase